MKKGGAFLAESTHMTSAPGKRVAPKGKRKRRKQQRGKLVAGIVLLSLLLVAAFVLLLWPAKNTLEGKWELDSVTAYVFYENGKGALVLPSSEYEFNYTVEEDQLILDYVDERAKDAQYTFRLEGDQLILNGGNATTQGEFVCVRSES